MNTTESVVRTLVDTQQIASLPLKSRDFLDLTLLAPGVVTDQGLGLRAARPTRSRSAA